MSIKGGDFIIKKTESSAVFVPEEWNEEEKMLKQMIHDFLDKELHVLESEPEASKDLPQIVEMLDKAAELGLCGIAIEEKYGGSDLSFNAGLLYMEAFAYGFSFATTIGTHVSIGSLPIVYYGNDQQKEKYLPKIATAEIKTAYALTEPSAGSDANSGKTKATIDTKNNCYLINGQKMWITNSGFAEVFIVFAKIEDDEKLSAFIIEKSFGGITLGEEEKKLGIKGSSTRQVYFENCPVPMENLLGKRNDGFKIALNILNSGRIKLSAATIGGSKFALSKAIQYSIEREQFGKSIGEFTAMQYKIGEMARKIFSAESAIYRTGRNIDLKEQELKENKIPEHEIKLKGLREFAIECSLMKVYASEVLDYCVDESLQIHGGMGYSVETKVEMGYRDARITRIYEGTNEINRMLIIGMLLKKAMKGSLDIMTPYQNILNNEPISIDEKCDNFEDEIILVENIKKTFLLLLGKAFEKYGPEIDKNQQVLLSLSDLAIEAYLSESTLKRTIKNINRSSLEDQYDQINMTKLYIYEACQIVMKKSNDVINSIIDQENQDKIYNSIINKLKYRKNPNVFELKTKIADKIISENKYCF